MPDNMPPSSFTIKADTNSLVIVQNRAAKHSEDELLSILLAHSNGLISSLEIAYFWLLILNIGAQERILRAIPPSVKTLTIRNAHFSHVECSKNNCNFTALKHIPQHVTKLDLSANDLGYAYSQYLLILGRVLQSFESINFAGNHLGETEKPGYIISFMRELAKSSSLRKLDLFQNELNENINIWIVALAAFKKKSLTHLNLGGNHLKSLKGKSIAYLLNAIPPSVQFLNLLGEASYPQKKDLQSKNVEIEQFLAELSPEQKIEYKATLILIQLKPIWENAKKNGFYPFNIQLDVIQNLKEDEIPDILNYFSLISNRINNYAFSCIQYYHSKNSAQVSNFFQLKQQARSLNKDPAYQPRSKLVWN